MTTPTQATSGDSIEIDDSAHAFSDYQDSDAASSTQSLASSLNKYLLENGRRYHAYYGTDKNFMPTDEAEKERLDIHHEIVQLILGGLHKAPLSNPQKVLDIGTGTGIWCIDFAEENPQAIVTGVDLSPIQPQWVPNNCKFEIDDLDRPWTYPEGEYDFIHGRNLLAAIKDIPALFDEIFKALKPGAYVEMGEFESAFLSDDNSIPADWPPVKCTELLQEALGKLGKRFWTGPEIADFMTAAGFVDVEVVKTKQPFGPWAKDKQLKQAGMLALVQSETMFHSYGLMLHTRVLGMSQEESVKICDAARDAVLLRARKEKVHQYSNFFSVYGRKPEN